MELTLTTLFFFLFGALTVLFAQGFWLQRKLKTGKVAHLGKKYAVMELVELRNQLRTITDLRILCEVQQEKLSECEQPVVQPEPVAPKATATRKPRVKKEKTQPVE